MQESVFQLTLPVPAERLWAFHEQEDVVEQLSPPWENLRILRHTHPLRLGGETLISMPFLPFVRICWLARFVDFVPGQRFTDEQIEGPMAFWQHHHIVTAIDEKNSMLEDRIQWRMKWWQLPPLMHGSIQRKLAKVFAYRHEMTKAWCLQGDHQASA